jgi:hypothetical protein
MADIHIENEHLVVDDLYPSKSTKCQIPIQNIDTIKVIERSSFYHPVIGVVFGLLCLLIASAFIVTGILNHWSPTLYLVPRGGLIWVPLFVGILTFICLFKSRKIPWIILHSNQGDLRIPINSRSFLETCSLAETIRISLTESKRN